ncbi:MAG: gas vesicle protein [Dehalococcoidia bacterium]
MMEPTRDAHFTLVDLLDRILDRGVVLYADIIVSVAGIPLIGVNLRAALAGMETMLKYGVMQDWDQRTRAWEREHRRDGERPLISGEGLRLKMLGSHYYSQGIYTTWRQGYFYLTDNRLLLYLPSFDKVLFEAPLEGIEGLAIKGGAGSNGDRRENLCLLFKGGGIAWLHALDTHQLKAAIEEGMAGLGLTWAQMPAPPLPDGEAASFLAQGEEVTCQGKMWHLMALPSPGGFTSDTWGPGHLYLTSRRLCWWHDFGEKVAFEIPVERVSALAVETRERGLLLKQKGVLNLIYETEQGKRVACFSGDKLPLWEEALSGIIAAQGATPAGDERDTCPRCGEEAPVRELLEGGCAHCGWVSPNLKKGLPQIAIG